GPPPPPPASLVEQAIKAVLPAYLTAGKTQTEYLPSGPQAGVVKFRATVVAAEELYVRPSPSGYGGSMSLAELLGSRTVKPTAQLRQEMPQEMFSFRSPYRAEAERLLRECDKTPQYVALKATMGAGAETTIYGKVSAERMLDKWTLDAPAFETNVQQFGQPRSAWGPQALVPGSQQAQSVADEYLRNRAALEKQLSGLVAKYKEGLQAEEKAKDQAKKLEEEAIQKRYAALLAATKPGMKYSLTARDEPIILQFTKQENDGAVLEAEMCHAKEPNKKKTYLGGIVRDTKTEFPIFLKPVASSGVLRDRKRAFVTVYEQPHNNTYHFTVDENGQLITNNPRWLAGLKRME
ncbi:MAG TPA: hypothetical protein DCX07_10260, partial [Phycisphaerales bacterium]|nr:hypothetical protein [Phycisphaerales bacterium]